MLDVLCRYGGSDAVCAARALGVLHWIYIYICLEGSHVPILCQSLCLNTLSPAAALDMARQASFCFKTKPQKVREIQMEIQMDRDLLPYYVDICNPHILQSEPV